MAFYCCIMVTFVLIFKTIMKIQEVKTKEDRRSWHRFQRELYALDPHFAAPFENRVEAIFTPGKNEFFDQGSAVRFLLTDDHGKTIGRAAAFINGKRAYSFRQPTGGMGFFDCIENKEAAFMLFDACRDWLKERGMQAMDGPINFGENDVFWGLLVDGFTASGWEMNYNPPFYRQFFEEYGFHPYFEQVSNLLDYTKPFPEEFWKVARWVISRNEFHCRHFEYAHADKFVHDLKEIYDDAWQYHENFVPIREDTLYHALQEGEGLIEEDMIWFVYNRREEPVGFIVMFPDPTPIFRRFNGKLNLWNKLRFLWAKNRHQMHRSRVTIMGVKVHYQRSGIESLMFWQLDKAMKQKPWYTEIELAWVGDFNPKMRSLQERMGASFHQKHITYRYLFDNRNRFERSAIIATDTKARKLAEESTPESSLDEKENRIQPNTNN